ncbi:aminotransferase class I/II-fold pyridoxal phosphate-dependent enzyme [Aquiflexum sp.]|uniref:aminotransferase class I/II-fold pyridoxal phosphate-dependent enzyme n=1 Tax=Aquiflexum sp. TaxID=1872584 RepID=UPI0035935B6A
MYKPLIINHAPKEKLSPQLEDFFHSYPQYNPAKEELLDIRPAHRWFEQLHRCVDADTYIFQKMYEGRQGPEALVEGRTLHVFSSYDYLGLIGHPAIDEAAINAIKVFSTGTGGVRLLTGTNELHDKLEHTICNFKKTESALAFTSGYLANLAAIAGLFDGRDVAIVDEYIHRSIIDAIRLAGIPCKTFKHNDLSSLRDVLTKNSGIARRALIIAEGIYSMDGDICPLPEIVALKEEFGAILLIDEAHSLGVLGKNGRGVDEYYGIDPNRIDIFTGSLSKAIPSNGGFIAAREDVIHFLKHGGAPFMFSAALSPPNAAAALTAIEVLKNELWRIKELWKNTEILLEGLKSMNINIGHSESPVIPIICGSNEKAFRLSKYLYDAGFLATSVIYPAVPHEMARIRLCCTATMKPEIIYDFIEQVKQHFAGLH